MQRQVERRPVLHQWQVEQTLDSIRPAQQGDAIANGVQSLFAEQLGQGGTQHLVRLAAHELGNVGTDAADQPVGAGGDQESERLDIAQHMDGFALAVGQIDLEAGRLTHCGLIIMSRKGGRGNNVPS